MAMFPCDYCLMRYKGAQQTVYPALVHNSASIREKRRACPVCFASVLQFAVRHLTLADNGGPPTPEECAIDGGELNGRVGVFVTLYALGQEREDWYGQICGGHAEQAGRVLFGAQTPLTGLLG